MNANADALRFPKRWLSLWLVALLALMAVVWLPRLQAQPDPLAILHLDECELPCWIGIVIGKTTIGEAERLIHARYQSSYVNELYTTPYPCCSFGRRFLIRMRDEAQRSLFIGLNQWSATQSDDAVVQDVHFSASAVDAIYTTKLLDLMLLLGAPACLGVQWGHHTAYPAMLYPQKSVQLTFGSERFEVEPNFPAAVNIYDRMPRHCNTGVEWRGFGYDYRPELLKTIQP